MPYKNLTPEEWTTKLNGDSNAVVLDVRTKAEYDSGHIDGAILMPNVTADADELDKTKNYYVHCRVGGRSALASQMLINKGFENVFNLNGPIEEVGIELIKS